MIKKYSYSKNKKCKICQIPITNNSTYCRKCSNKMFAKKGKNCHFYVDGVFLKEKTCIDCGKILKSHNRSVKRCKDCQGKKRQKHYHCINCGKKVSSKAIKRCRICYVSLLRQHPELVPNYKDGRSKKIYNGEFTESLKEMIRLRDNCKCRICKSSQNKNHLDVHHIDCNKFNNHPNNLVALCKKCHSRIHGLIQIKKKQKFNANKKL